MEDEMEFYRYWSIYKTIMHLCKDRGYMETLLDRGYVVTLLDRGYLVTLLDEFKQMFSHHSTGGLSSRSELNLIVSHAKDVSNQMFVFFPDDEKINVVAVKRYFNKMQTENVHRSIIVVHQGVTPTARQAMVSMRSASFIMEEFMEAELMINITEHELVPTHYVMSPEEKKELLMRYKLKETQLPRIQHTDPVARYLGLKRGEVVKIIRPSETAGRYITYRLVQ
eukprot:TRINITY_DN9363_c1_g2_i1.p1 TRINITY_DN9363_c1_g2~~TRINITY_DN9363_c1_g2_i1.p1  ORF type:complete len:224 (-),score=37.83 TRINITY_DN9363_c1_g2_i1:103-774(-)